jgi:hypothetical protein
MRCTAVQVTPNDTVHTIDIGGVDDIADAVRERHIESLTSTDRSLDFWFATSIHPSHHLNRVATQLLLAATQFTASNVPLLHGYVVLASHDRAGNLATITRQHIRALVGRNHLTRRAAWTLNRRYAKDEHTRTRRAVARARAHSVFYRR